MERPPFTPPSHGEGRFNCPHCLAFAEQLWSDTLHNPFDDGYSRLERVETTVCRHCDGFAIWLDDQMIYPRAVAVSPPNPDLQEDIQNDYNEAARILDESPRGSAALVRLCLQKLCVQLGEPGKNINSDIGSLVGKGLPQTVQQALDVVRVVGNNAVHPGQIDLRDDRDTAARLFELVNLITNIMITQPKEVAAFYQSLPQDARASIQNRDAGK